MDHTVRVLIVEDHAALRGELVDALSNAGGLEIMGDCGDGVTAVELALDTRPDVIVMDLRLPGIDGLDATRRILAKWPQARVLIHTTDTGSPEARAALRSGAFAVVPKSMLVGPLVQAIRSVVRKSDPLSN